MVKGTTSEFFVLFIVLLLITGGVWTILFSFFMAASLSWIWRNFSQKKLPITGEAILITGASKGIGKDAALRLSDLGFYVFAGIRDEADAKILQSASKNPTRMIPVLLDITKKDIIDASLLVVKNVLRKKGLKLVGLVNNAGYNENGPLELIQRDRLLKQFEVNVVGQVMVTQAYLPLLRDVSSSNRTSRIVFISSGSGLVTLPMNAPYCASKHALESIADGFRIELKQFQIDVVIIEPGSVVSSFRSVTAETSSQMISMAKSNEMYCSKEVIEEYEKTMERNKRSGSQSPTFVVSEAIEEAVLSSKPLTRYFVGKSSSVFGFIQLLPETILDYVFKLK